MPYALTCPACEGPGGMVGILGRLAHFQCRHCGSAWHCCADDPEVADILTEGAQP